MQRSRAVTLALCSIALAVACKKDESINSADDYWSAQAQINKKLVALMSAGSKACDTLALDISRFYEEVKPTNEVLVAYEKNHPDVYQQAKADALQEEQRVALEPCLGNKQVLQALSRSPVLPTPSWAVEPK